MNRERHEALLSCRSQRLNTTGLNRLASVKQGATTLATYAYDGTGLHAEDHLPKQFRPEFERAGLDIEKYKIPRPRETHKIIHGKGGGEAWRYSWNQQWKGFFKDNPAADADDILVQLDRMKGGSDCSEGFL